MIPVWLIRYGLPALAAALALIAAYFWAYGQGRTAERAKWEVASAAAAKVQRERELALQAQVDAAGAALSEQSALMAQVLDSAKGNTRNYYVQNPSSDVACIKPERVQHVAETDAAAAGNPAPAR
jgi:hypothetical protein